MNSVLFVCMGNICRSPAAEGVMLNLIEQAGLQDQIHIDSAGTHGYHIGKLPDHRMRAAAAKRGINLQHRAREVDAADLETFDLILVMDADNLANVRALDHRQQYHDKIRLFCEYCTEHDEKYVPDPYYGGEAGFEHVLDLLEDGCTNLLKEIQKQNPEKISDSSVSH